MNPKFRTYLKEHLTVIALILFAFFISVEPGYAQTKYTNSYREVGINQGLSQSTVRKIVQDSLGFMWIATGDGLNRYDGYEFTIYRHQPENPSSISDNWILDIHIDYDQNLWIATEFGLNRFDYQSQSFEHFLPDSTQNSISGSYIYDIDSDTLGNIWVGTTSGISRYNVNEDHFYNYNHNPADSASLPSDNILSVDVGPTLDLWFGTDEFGVGKLSYPDYELTRLPIGNLPDSLPDGYISHVFETPFQKLIIGSLISGLYEYDLKTEEFHHLQQIKGLPPSDQFYFVRSIEMIDNALYVSTKSGILIYQFNGERLVMTDSLAPSWLDEDTPNTVTTDHSNNLWVGTELYGAYMINNHIKPFYTQASTQSKNTLNNPVVWNFHQDEDGTLWIATEDGVSVSTSPGKIDSTLLPGKYYNSPDYINSGEISAVAGNDEFIWIGTFYGGLNEYNRSTGKFKQYYPAVTDSGMVGYTVISMLYDERGYVWMGTYEGLTQYDIRKKEFVTFRNDSSDPNSIPSNTIWGIRKDSTGRLWLATNKGLATYSLETNAFESVTLSGKQNEKANNQKNSVNDIYFDRYGNKWITTAYGITILDQNNQPVREITTENGLPNDYVYNILEGKHSNELWASTNLGLARITFNKALDSLNIQRFDRFDGIGGNEFNAGAAFKSDDGMMYFGGMHGYTYFRADDIVLNSNPPKIIISDIEMIDKDKRESMSLLLKEKFEISYTKDVLFIDLSIIDFTIPEQNSYRYRLKGFSDTWIEGIGKPTVIYTSIPPGTYTFEAQGANHDGVWSEATTQMTIRVIPPFYRTIAFYTFAGLLLAGGLIFATRYRERQFKFRNERLESEVKKQTSELRQSEQIFRQISDNAGELISMIDPKGLVLYANPTHKSILGWEASELERKNVYDYVHPEDIEVLKIETQKLLNEGLINYSEYRLKHKNGTWRTFETSGSLVQDDVDTGHRFVMVSHDVTRQKKIQNYLIESRNEAERANQAKSAFLAGISHELRTPLNAILGFSQILRKETNLSPRQQSYVDTMLKSGNHLLDMINEVLDISKIEANRMQVNYDTFSLKSMLSDVHQIFSNSASDKGLEYLAEQEEEIPGFIYSDAGKIRQILINLIGNAVKFTQSGHVRISISTIDNLKQKFKTKTLINSWAEHISEEPQLTGIEVKIQDTGRGISKEHLEHIFEPFQQVLEDKNYSEGTGLGLAISSKLAHLLGGTISVNSELNAGSVFTLQVPVLRAGKPSLVVKNDSEQPMYYQIEGNQRPKVLVVDDIEYNLTLLKEILDPVGFITSGVYNGKEAIEMLKSFTPNVILMDLKMPVMDGEEAMRAIRSMKNGDKIIIIAISASGFENTRKDMIDAGFDDFIHKPFKENELLELIGGQLGIDYRKEQSKIKNTTSEEDVDQQIHQMDAALREELLESLELMDWDRLDKIIDQLEIKGEFFNRLKSVVQERHYLGIIKLNDQIQENLD